MSFVPHLRAIFAAYHYAAVCEQPVPTMLMAAIESAKGALAHYEEEERERYAHLNDEARAEEAGREETILHPERFR